MCSEIHQQTNRISDQFPGILPRSNWFPIQILCSKEICSAITKMDSSLQPPQSGTNTSKGTVHATLQLFGMVRRPRLLPAQNRPATGGSPCSARLPRDGHCTVTASVTADMNFGESCCQLRFAQCERAAFLLTSAAACAECVLGVRSQHRLLPTQCVRNR